MEADRILFANTAWDDAEWNLQPIVDKALIIWNNFHDEIVGLHEHVIKDEWEENLQHFMEKAEKLWEIDSRVAKLLFDVCTTLDNGKADIAVTITEEGPNELKITKIYKGLSFSNSAPDKDYSLPIIAVVNFDGEVDNILFGHDAEEMQTSIRKWYQDDYSRDPDNIYFARRI